MLRAQSEFSVSHVRVVLFIRQQALQKKSVYA